MRLIDRQGASYERLRLTRKGDPDDPLSDEELRDKFDELVPPFVGRPRAEAIAGALWKLPAIPRMSPGRSRWTRRSRRRPGPAVGALPAAERAAILWRAARLLDSCRDTPLAQYVAETGFTPADAVTELDRTRLILELRAQEALWLTAEMVPVQAAVGHHDSLCFTPRVPVGVVVAITPFNVPLSTVVHKIAPALAAGNAVILKPAEQTPLSAVAVVRVLLEASLLEPRTQLLPGSGETVGEQLVRHRDVRCITFTGSTGSDDYGSAHYWIRILGTPSSSGKWTVQYGGHHLAVNITLTGDTMTFAPTLFGVQPATYTLNGVSHEPPAGETDKAFAVVQSLNSAQLDAAILDMAVTEIILGAGQDGKTLAYEGVKASTFTSAQKTLLLDLITEWISPLNDEQAASKLESAEANLDSTYFAWSGSTSSDQPIYYRVQSPTSPSSSPTSGTWVAQATSMPSTARTATTTVQRTDP